MTRVTWLFKYLKSKLGAPKLLDKLVHFLRSQGSSSEEATDDEATSSELTEVLMDQTTQDCFQQGNLQSDVLPPPDLSSLYLA